MAGIDCDVAEVNVAIELSGGPPYVRVTGIDKVLAPLVADTVTVPLPVLLPAGVVHWKLHDTVCVPVHVLLMMLP